MIKAVRGNITSLRVNFVGSRPAIKSLPAAATWGYSLVNKSLLNADSPHRRRPTKPVNLLDRVRKTPSTNVGHRPPATKSL